MGEVDPRFLYIRALSQHPRTTSTALGTIPGVLAKSGPTVFPFNRRAHGILQTQQILFYRILVYDFHFVHLNMSYSTSPRAKITGAAYLVNSHRKCRLLACATRNRPLILRPMPTPIKPDSKATISDPSEKVVHYRDRQSKPSRRAGAGRGRCSLALRDGSGASVPARFSPLSTRIYPLRMVAKAILYAPQYL